jgi:replicative DNA helicase
MRRKGHSEDGIFAALVIFNREKCNPPLTDGEVLQIAKSVSRYPAQDEIKPTPRIDAAYSVIDNLEAEIREREKNPCDVWGIHYASFPYLSLITGGKQRGELIILAGEPGVGKSWWAHQDALFTAIGSGVIESTPVLLWSGEMSRKQVYRRFFEMLGVPKRNMLKGKMSQDDWQVFNEAKALMVNSPIYVSDMPLELKSVKGLLVREIGEHGIKQVIFDYDWLINAPGSNEIEQSQNTSRLLKQLSRELDLSIILISSVNKTGMDTTSENVTKSNVSGSGKKLHDADVIYILTKFNEKKNSDLGILPCDYEKISTMHIAKGRELDYHVPNGAINYMRETPNPKFKELKKTEILPSWMK